MNFPVLVVLKGLGGRYMFLFNIIVLGSAVPSDWPFYCPQITPDYTINYTITPTFTTTNYCPQTIPDYSFAQPP